MIFIRFDNSLESYIMYTRNTNYKNIYTLYRSSFKQKGKMNEFVKRWMLF